jgi:hypothetical protein
MIQMNKIITNWKAWCTSSGVPWHWVSLSGFASFHNMWSCKWIPIFQRSILPPSSRSRCLEWGCSPQAYHRSSPFKYWRSEDDYLQGHDSLILLLSQSLVHYLQQSLLLQFWVTKLIVTI